MKKIFVAIIALLLLSISLTSCDANVPRPEIKEGRFNFSVTYEHNGEVKTVSGVYVCKYDGIIWYNPNRDPFVNWEESFEGDGLNEYGNVPIYTTDAGEEILIGILLYPEYFMGDPAYANYEPRVEAELFSSEYQSRDPEVLAEYGVKLISYEFDEPIDNTYESKLTFSRFVPSIN